MGFSIEKEECAKILICGRPLFVNDILEKSSDVRD